jgi:putative transposase
MKKSRFSEEQMVKILREADRVPVAEVAKKHGVSDGWRKRFGQLEAVDVKRLRQIETENARLKKLLAERDLEIEVMKEVAANGKRARAPPAGCLPSTGRPVDPASVRADVSGQINIALRVASDRARRAGGDGDAHAKLLYARRKAMMQGGQESLRQMFEARRIGV